MDVKDIIEELLDHNIISSRNIEYKPLRGGTVSEIYLLFREDSEQLVVKLNQPIIVKSEALFLEYYKSLELLPNLLYVDPSYRYIVYSFIPGSSLYVRKNKRKMLITLVNGLLNHYRAVPAHTGWGWVDEPTDLWNHFLFKRAAEAEQTLDFLEKKDYQLVLNLIEKTKVEKPFLLHGDCGVHNFIFKGDRLTGVIDPTPVIGEPLYDLVYAFCSSPEDLTTETIDFAYSQLRVRPTDLYEQVVIGLYLRLASCVKHHPHDLEEYLKAWSYWKQIVQQFEIKEIHDLMKIDLSDLVKESQREGFRFLERLMTDYQEGINTFKKEGEYLYGIFDRNGKVIAVGGLNRDPNSRDQNFGRLRRFYVAKDYRRNGIGTLLLNAIISKARNHFTVLLLHTDTKEADTFYTSYGFCKGQHSPNSTHYLYL